MQKRITPTKTSLPAGGGKSDIMERARNGLLIDKHNLDLELEKDAALVQEIGDEYALACSRRDEIKLERDETLARLDLKVRQEAEEKGVKITEKNVQSQIDLSDEIKDVRRRYLSACEVADRLDVLVRAYYVRAADIRALGELYKSGYYSTNNHVRARDYEADRAEQSGANNSTRYGKREQQ